VHFGASCCGCGFFFECVAPLFSGAAVDVIGGVERLGFKFGMRWLRCTAALPFLRGA